MNRLFLYMLLLVLSAKSYAQDSLAIARQNFGKLTWLQGSWLRTNSKPGRTTMETWAVTGKYEMKGSGITLKGEDTAFTEKIKLTIKGRHIYYVADVPDNKGEIYFRCTAISDHAFICENPQHDFPQKIEYVFRGDTLKAVVSGSGRSIEYVFRKQR